MNKSLKWHVESISCKNNTFVKTELYCKYLNSMKSFKNSKKHVKIIDVYSLYLFFRMSKLLNNIYRARCLSLGVKTSSIHLFFQTNACFFETCMKCPKRHNFSKMPIWYKVLLELFLYHSLTVYELFSPGIIFAFFICKRFCTVLNSLKQSCVWREIV